MKRAIVWFRRDLRLSDHAALQAALRDGYAPVPVYIHAPDESGEWAPGAASRVWLRRSLAALDADLRARGSGLLLRAGDSLDVLRALVRDTGAEAVFWHRQYEPAHKARDTRVKAALREDGLRAESFNGALLCEPWTVATGSGTPYRVFTPFWKAAQRQLDSQPALCDAPAGLPAPPASLQGLALEALGLDPPAREGPWDADFWMHWTPGEAGAHEALSVFLDGALRGYAEQRDLPDRAGTSRLSPHLHFGEIAPWRIVHALRAQALPAAFGRDLERYLAELGWREFSHHLLHHWPETPTRNFNPRFDTFPWAESDPALLLAWQRGRTGIPLVDAGMRELWATGWMHNRIRMLVASVLTKHLRQHWLHGARWFWDTLVDADLANNTQGWQWTAGSGADAAPYYRIFSPSAQVERFDPKGRYIRRWVPELARLPDAALAEPWAHPELLRRLAPDYPRRPVVDLRAGREAALAAYAAIR